MSTLIDNERTKLLAGAVDRASTACLTVGVLAPLAALLYNLSGTQISMLTLTFGGIVWFLSAVALHLLARWTLRYLVA